MASSVLFVNKCHKINPHNTDRPWLSTKKTSKKQQSEVDLNFGDHRVTTGFARHCFRRTCNVAHLKLFIRDMMALMSTWRPSKVTASPRLWFQIIMSLFKLSPSEICGCWRFFSRIALFALPLTSPFLKPTASIPCCPELQSDRYVETEIAKNTEMFGGYGTLYSSIEAECPKMQCVAYLRKMRVSSAEYRVGMYVSNKLSEKNCNKKKNARTQNPKLLLRVGLLLIESHDK